MRSRLCDEDVAAAAGGGGGEITNRAPYRLQPQRRCAGRSRGSCNRYAPTEQCGTRISRADNPPSSPMRRGVLLVELNCEGATHAYRTQALTGVRLASCHHRVLAYAFTRKSCSIQFNFSLDVSSITVPPSTTSFRTLLTRNLQCRALKHARAISVDGHEGTVVCFLPSFLLPTDTSHFYFIRTRL